jgi:amino acid transporter
MKRTPLTYGLISGALSSLMMIATAPFLHTMSFQMGLLVGYTAIVLSFLLVFFGIRSYRDHQGDGKITFARGFAVGILITLITCVCYVVTWEVLYFNFVHGVMDSYFAKMIANAKAAGGTPAVIQAKLDAIQKSRDSYENPLYNSAQTFLEPFPVGLLITLISATILRKKPKPQPVRTPLPAA